MISGKDDSADRTTEGSADSSLPLVEGAALAETAVADGGSLGIGAGAPDNNGLMTEGAEGATLPGFQEAGRGKERACAHHKQTSGRRTRRTVPLCTCSSHSSDSEGTPADEAHSCNHLGVARTMRRRGAGLVLAKQFAKRVLLRSFGNPRRGGVNVSSGRLPRGRAHAQAVPKKVSQVKNGEISENESLDGGNTLVQDGVATTQPALSDDDDGWMEVNDEVSSEASSANGEESSDRDSVFRSSFESFKKKGNRSGEESESYVEMSDRSEELEATLMGSPEAPQLGQFLLPLLQVQEEHQNAVNCHGREITLIHDKILEILTSTEEQMNLQQNELQPDNTGNRMTVPSETADDQSPYPDGFSQQIADEDVTDMLEQMEHVDTTEACSNSDSSDHIFVSMDTYPESAPQFNREYDLEWWKTMACALSALGGAGAVVVTESETKWRGLIKLPCLCCHCRNKKTYMETIRHHLSLMISVMKLNDETAKEAELLEAMLQPASCACTVFYTNVTGVSQGCHRCLQNVLSAKIEQLKSSVEAWRHLSQLVEVITANEVLTAAADSACCCQRDTELAPPAEPLRQLSHDDQVRRAVAFFVSGVKDISYFKVNIRPTVDDAPKSRALRFLDFLQKNGRLKIAPLRGQDSNYPAKEWTPPCPECACSCATVRTYSRSECTKALSDALKRMNSLASTAGLPDLISEELVPELAVLLTESRAATIAMCSTRDTAHKLLTDIVVGCDWACAINLLKSPQIIFDDDVCTVYSVFTTLLARRFIDIACQKYPKTRMGLTLMVSGDHFDLFSSFMLARAFMGELTNYTDSYLTLDDVSVEEFDKRLVKLVNVLSINTAGTEVLSVVYEPEKNLYPVRIEKNIPSIEKFVLKVKSGCSEEEGGTSDEMELELLHTMDYLIKTAKSLVSLMYLVLNHAGLQGNTKDDPKLSVSLSQAYSIMHEFCVPGPEPVLQCCSGGQRVQDWRCLNGKLLEFDTQVMELYARIPSIHRTQTRALQKILDILKTTYPTLVGVPLLSLRYCRMGVPFPGLSRAMIAHQTFTPRYSQRVLAWLVYTRILAHSHLFNEIHRKVIELQEQYEINARMRVHPLSRPAVISDRNIVRGPSEDLPSSGIPPMDIPPLNVPQQRAGKRKLKPVKSDEKNEGDGDANKKPDVFYFNHKGNKHQHNGSPPSQCDKSMSMRECIAKFVKCNVSGNQTSESPSDQKYDCRSPPLAEVPPKEVSDSKMVFRRVKGPFRQPFGQQSALYNHFNRTGMNLANSKKTDEVNTDKIDNIPKECDPKDVMLLESVAPLEDNAIDKIIEANAHLNLANSKTESKQSPLKDEHCKMKCCQNETGNIFEKIFNTLMLMNKSADAKAVLSGEVLVAKCMQEAMKISDSPDDIKGVPRILLSIMPEVAAKLAELVSISTELPEFASIICSLPDCIDDTQSLSPETIKQLKELRMSRNETSKVTKSKWKNKKNKQNQSDESTETSVDGNRNLMEILREEIEKEVQTFFKIKDRSKDEQNVFSLWAKWMVIDKILDHVKQFMSDAGANKSAGLEAWRDILPKLKDLQSLSIETISTLRKLAFSIPKSSDETEDSKTKDNLQQTTKSKKCSSSPKSKDNGLSIEHLILCSSPDKIQAVSDEKVSKIILEMNNIQCKGGLRPEGFDETKQAYFIDKLQAINKNYVEKLHKRNFTSEDWIMTMNELQELERKLKSAFSRPLVGQPKAVETREGEIVAGKGLSKLIGKSSSKNTSKDGGQKAASKVAMEKTSQNTESSHAQSATNSTPAASESVECEYVSEVEELAMKGQLLARCEELLKSRGDKSLLDSFYSIKRFVTLGEPVPDNYMEQVATICSTMDPTLFVDGLTGKLTMKTPDQMEQTSNQADKPHADSRSSNCDSCHQSAVHNGCKAGSESDSCSAHDDEDFGCCGPHGNHIAIIGSQNPEAIAKYTAMALRKVKQSLNASAFPQADGSTAIGNGVAETIEGGHFANCCGKKCRRTQTQTQPPKQAKDTPVAAAPDSKPAQGKCAPNSNAAGPAGQHRNGKKCDSGNNSGHHYICRVGHVDGAATGCGGGGGSHSCNCCYCAVYGHAPPVTSPVSKTFNETRERLRSILFKKKQQEKAGDSETSKDQKSSPVDENSTQKDQTVPQQQSTGEASAEPATAKVSTEPSAQQEKIVQPQEKIKDPPKEAPASILPQTRPQIADKPKPSATANLIETVVKPPVQSQNVQNPTQPAKPAVVGQQNPPVAQQKAAPVHGQQKQQPVQVKQPAPAAKSTATPVDKKIPHVVKSVGAGRVATQTVLQEATKLLEEEVNSNDPLKKIMMSKLLQSPNSMSSRDVSVDSVSSGCFSYTTLCQNGGRRRSLNACQGRQPILKDDPRDLDALLQFIEGPNRGNDKSKKRAKKARQKARKVELRLTHECVVAESSASNAIQAAFKARSEAQILKEQVEETRRQLKKIRKTEATQPQQQQQKKKGKKGGQGNNQTSAASRQQAQLVQSVVEHLGKLTLLFKQAFEVAERADHMAIVASESATSARRDLMAAIESTGGSTLDDVDDENDGELLKTRYEPHTPDGSPPPLHPLEQEVKDALFLDVVTFKNISGHTIALMRDGTQLPLADFINRKMPKEGNDYIPGSNAGHTIGKTQANPNQGKKSANAPTSWEAALAQINTLANTANNTTTKKKEREKEKKKPEQIPFQPALTKPAPTQLISNAQKKIAAIAQQNREKLASKQLLEEADTSQFNKKERKAHSKKADEAAKIEEELKEAQKEKKKLNKSKKSGKENLKQTVITEQPTQKKGKKGVEAKQTSQASQNVGQVAGKNQVKSQAKGAKDPMTNGLNAQSNQSQLKGQNVGKQAQTGKKQQQQATNVKVKQPAQATLGKQAQKGVGGGSGRAGIDSSVSSLARRLDTSLKLNADTTIELANSKKLHTSGSHQQMRNSPTACSIMEQLSSGVQVADLKLPPGITLTRVDPSKQMSNPIKSIPMPTKPPASMPTLPKPLIPHGGVIHAEPPPPPTCFPPLPTIVTNHSQSADGNTAPSKKRNKKRNNKKNGSAQTPDNTSAPNQIVTLRNPLYHPDKPTVSVAVQGQPTESTGPVTAGPTANILRIPDPIPMPPTACRATITPAPNGMFTIRSPMLSAAAMQREAPPPVPPSTLAHSPHPPHPQVHAQLLPAPSKDRCYSLFDGSMSAPPAEQPVNREPVQVTPPVQQEPIGTPLRRTTTTTTAPLYSLFSPPQSQPDDSLPYFQRLRAGSRLNNEVTIHHVTESKYYRPNSYGTIPESPIAPPTSVEISVVPGAVHESYASAFRPPAPCKQPMSSSAPAPWNYATPSTSSSSLSSSLETATANGRNGNVSQSAANSLYGSVCNSSANSPAQQHITSEPNLCVGLSDGWAAWSTQAEPPPTSEVWSQPSAPPADAPRVPPKAQFGPIGSHRHNSHQHTNSNSIFSDCAPQYQTLNELELDAFKRYDYYMDPPADRLHTALSAMQLEK